MPLSDEQKAFRKTGIGGSDAAAILGLSPWITPLQLYLEKRGELNEPEKESESMEQGKALEPVLCRAYELLKGVSVDIPTQTLRHPKHSFMLANLDGVINENKILELKTSGSAKDWGIEGEDIPLYYNTQIQHYMAVVNAKEADVAVLMADIPLKRMLIDDIAKQGIEEVADRIITYFDFRVYTVKRDEQIISLLIEKEKSFWQRVQEGKPPEISTINDWKLLYKQKLTDENAECNSSILNAAIELKKINTLKRELEEKEKELKKQVVMFMKNRKTLVYNGYPLGAIIKKTYTTEPQTIDTMYFQLTSNKSIWQNIIKD